SDWSSDVCSSDLLFPQYLPDAKALLLQIRTKGVDRLGALTLASPGTSATRVAGPPASGSLYSFAPEKYARDRPSGEKNGFRAFCVPARGAGSSSSSLRLNSWLPVATELT